MNGWPIRTRVFCEEIARQRQQHARRRARAGPVDAAHGDRRLVELAGMRRGRRRRARTRAATSAIERGARLARCRPAAYSRAACRGARASWARWSWRRRTRSARRLAAVARASSASVRRSLRRRPAPGAITHDDDRRRTARRRPAERAAHGPARHGRDLDVARRRPDPSARLPRISHRDGPHAPASVTARGRRARIRGAHVFRRRQRVGVTLHPDERRMASMQDEQTDEAAEPTRRGHERRHRGRHPRRRSVEAGRRARAGRPSSTPPSSRAPDASGAAAAEARARGSRRRPRHDRPRAGAHSTTSISTRSARRPTADRAHVSARSAGAGRDERPGPYISLHEQRSLGRRAGWSGPRRPAGRPAHRRRGPRRLLPRGHGGRALPSDPSVVSIRVGRPRGGGPTGPAAGS